ncbi:MAG: SDR family oxidoreductase [Alphaproteobacteria bacterium]|nr:SDR family oxidoreductase [Alphaproteobacteria bacterium]
MNILVVGANGRTGRYILPLLKEAGHTARAMIRNYDQRGDIVALGAEAVAGDLEKPLGYAVGDNRACIFVAGSGSKTGPEKTIDVDFHGAVRLIETCERKKVRRFIMLSSMNTDEPESGPEKLRHYLAAKAAADERLRQSLMDWTIVRPGYLNDEASHEMLEISASLGGLEGAGSIGREDVAKVLVACLGRDNTVGKTFDIVDGKTPLEEALDSI